MAWQKNVKKWAFLACFFLVGCASSETVYMRNAAGDQIKCGPYTDFGNIPAANRSTLDKLRLCMADFERQGYRRVAAP